MQALNTKGRSPWKHTCKWGPVHLRTPWPLLHRITTQWGPTAKQQLHSSHHSDKLPSDKRGKARLLAAWPCKHLTAQGALAATSCTSYRRNTLTPPSAHTLCPTSLVKWKISEARGSPVFLLTYLISIGTTFSNNKNCLFLAQHRTMEPSLTQHLVQGTKVLWNKGELTSPESLPKTCLQIATSALLEILE